MKAEFKQFKPEDYQAVYEFFVELNQNGKAYMNWNWARWEWGYFHLEFDRSLIPYIGIWVQENKVVGVAAFDLYLGEAFCGALPGYEALLSEIVDYAWEKLSDENGLGICVNEKNEGMIKLLTRKGFQKKEQREQMLRISLEKPLQYDLPESCRIKELVFPRDSYAYQFLLWQGFNHGNDVKEFEKTKQDTVMQQPHRRPELALAVTDGAGNFIAHCGCWYADATDYAYVEPVCVVPEARKQGIGRAVVSEALNRCRKLGAKEAYVLSEQEFYQRLGFEKYTKHVFYWKKER